MDNLVFSPILSSSQYYQSIEIRESVFWWDNCPVLSSISVHITVEKLLKYLRVRSLQTHHCQIVFCVIVFCIQLWGVSYWLNDGNCLDTGIWRAISSTRQINNDASSLPYVYMYLWGSEDIQWLTNASPGGNWMAGKNAPVRSPQIKIHSRHPIRMYNPARKKL